MPALQWAWSSAHHRVGAASVLLISCSHFHLDHSMSFSFFVRLQRAAVIYRDSRISAPFHRGGWSRGNGSIHVCTYIVPLPRRSFSARMRRPHFVLSCVNFSPWYVS